jgi:hypothetical protein
VVGVVRVLVVLSVVGAALVVPAAPGSGATLGEPVGVLEGAAPGDVLTNGTLSVIVPDAGQGVWAEAILPNGTMEEIGVVTRPDGSVEVTSWGSPDQIGLGALPTSAPECSDGAHTKLTFKWTRKHRWFFNAKSTPAGLARKSVERSVKRATTNITRAANACRMKDTVRAVASYRGKTTKGTQTTAEGACAAKGDGRSVTGFGQLPVTQLGLACVWFKGRRAMESDVLLNNNTHSWTTGTGGSCVERWNVEAVMTHERGHTFGLGHVDEVEHGNLTMSERINGTCQKSEARLGKGDIAGLRSLYRR